MKKEEIRQSFQKKKLAFSAQKVSILILYMLWLGGGCSLLGGGISVIWGALNKNDSNSWLLAGIILALALGTLKSRTVLKKVSQKNIKESANLKDKFWDYSLGWLKTLGWKSVCLIILMISIGSLFSKILITEAYYRSLLRITIGSALFLGSFNYLDTIKNS